MRNSMEKQNFNTPTIFVIFGVTGDLSQKKLIPALFDLFDQGLLPDKFAVLGVAHSDYTDVSFRDEVQEILCGVEHGHTRKTVAKFVAMCSYHRGSFEEPKMYDNIARKLQKIDDAFGQCSNKLFHLAVAPRFYPTIVQQLSDTGLTEACSDETGWTRVLLEKPLGDSAQSAEELDQLLGKLFNESQVFRIDHYLGKGTIQNILTFRFSNVLFEPVWNARYIEKVHIRLFETVDVSGRGGFYDSVGALMDVGQNHMLQMLATVAMEHPQTLNEKAIRTARAAVIDRLRAAPESFVRGQYDGYHDVEGVADNSQTETFFRLRTHIDDERWHDVPFFLESGKALDEKKTEIAVTFKEAHPCLCPGLDHGKANTIVFSIQPEEKISVRFLARGQSFKQETEGKDLSFSYERKTAHEKIDAYEKILHDAITGDQTLFRSSAEIDAAWKFIDPILEKWNDVPLVKYDKGTDAKNITNSKQ